MAVSKRTCCSYKELEIWFPEPTLGSLQLPVTPAIGTQQLYSLGALIYMYKATQTPTYT